MPNRFEIKLARERLRPEGSLIEGLGAFARIGFRRGNLICVFKGENISISELKSRYKAGVERISDTLQISERRYLDLDEPFVRINHSCDPNTAIVSEANLVVLRPIDQGEEITFDYSLTEWTWERFGKYAEWDMPCACGSPSCRGHITQFPFIPLSVKRDYLRKGALPDFIMRKIIKTGLAYDGRRES